MFDFTCRNFKAKRREFCYAGDWTFKLDLATGELRSCYFSLPFCNIYTDIDEKIKTLTVGNNCGSSYCVNSSHFMSLGVIPEIQCPTYAGLRDRPEAHWYNPRMRAFLDTRLYDTNTQYSPMKKCFVNIRFKVRRLISRVMRKIKTLISRRE